MPPVVGDKPVRADGRFDVGGNRRQPETRPARCRRSARQARTPRCPRTGGALNALFSASVQIGDGKARGASCRRPSVFVTARAAGTGVCAHAAREQDDEATALQHIVVCRLATPL
jgi:hypothetical protein